MQSHVVKPEGKKDRPDFPETYKLLDGASVVAMAIAFKSKAGKFEQDVYEVIIRGTDESKSFSLWWPFRLPAVPMFVPFLLRRISKSAYDLLVTETEEESAGLWRTGEVAKSNGSAGGVQIIPPRAAELLKKYGASTPLKPA